MSNTATDPIQPIKDRLSRRPNSVWGYVEETLYAGGTPCEHRAQLVEEDEEGNIVRVIADNLNIGEAEFMANAPCDIEFLIKQLQNQIARANDYKRDNEIYRSIYSAQTSPVPKPPTQPKAGNVVTVRWFDGYLEEFEADEVRFGSDILWLRLADGKNRHIPLRHVRWFGMTQESHQRQEAAK